ncbi:VapE domain-containing protein [Paraburkholderia diazotrophica]|nr:VapE domain-containing protein [Paraburkholderia diazotrophica]
MRSDIHGRKTADGQKCARRPLSDRALLAHFSGGEPVGLYPMAKGSSETQVGVLDFDSHRGATPWSEMFTTAQRVALRAAAFGLVAHAFRSSGGRGVHLIFMWDVPQHAYSVRELLREILHAEGLSSGTTGVVNGQVEIFPKSDFCFDCGNFFVLPLGGKSLPLDIEDIDDAPLPSEWLLGRDWVASAHVPLRERPAPRAMSVDGLTMDLKRVRAYLDLIPNSGADDLPFGEGSGEGGRAYLDLMIATHRATGGSEEGMALYAEMAGRSAKFRMEDLEHRWPSITPREGGITVRTLIAAARHYAPEAVAAIELAGVVDEFDTMAPVPISLYANYQGRPWSRQLMKTEGKNPRPLCNEANAAWALRNEPLFDKLFAYNTFSDRVDVLRANDFGLPVGEWKDGHDLVLLEWFQRIGLQFNHTQVERAVNIVAAERAYNPVQDYLRGLVWDGTLRLDTWLRDYVGAEQTAYKRAVGSRWMIGAVARALLPGAKMDNALIFEGAQGKFKSTVFDVLGGAWFQDTCPDIGRKDALENLRGAWIIEMGELSAMRAAEIEPMKQFIAARQDRYRPSYGRRAANYPRTCVFAGTTNGEKYLKDDENRRFWPVSVGTIDIQALRRDRDQLWAEAVHRFNAGEQWWLNAAETVDAVGEQAARKADDDWLPIIAAWLANLDGDFEGIDSHITNARIKTDALRIPISELGRRDADKDGKRIRYVMETLGYQRGKQIRVNGVPDRPWLK